jgi:hypothetical protein
LGKSKEKGETYQLGRKKTLTNCGVGQKDPAESTSNQIKIQKFANNEFNVSFD